MSIKAGATSQTIPLFITDTSNDPLTGLAYNTSGLTCYYARPRAAPVAVTLATLAAVDSAWSSGGFKEISATDMPGWYRFDIPNAAIASGATSVGIHFKGAASMSPLPIKIDLVAFDPQQDDLGLTIPSAAAIASQVQADTTLADLANMIVSEVFTSGALANAPGGSGQAVSAFAVLGLRSRISGQIDDDDYIPVIGGDDKSVGIFFEDASGNPAPLPSGATAAMLDASGATVGTSTIVDSKITIGYLLVRLQVPSSGNQPAKLRITFDGGAGAGYNWDVVIRAWS